MKSLTVNFVGPVRRPGPQRSITIDTSDLKTVADALSSLGYEAHEQARLHILADGAHVNTDAPLQGMETMEILVAIGGG